MERKTYEISKNDGFPARWGLMPGPGAAAQTHYALRRQKKERLTRKCPPVDMTGGFCYTETVNNNQF